VFVINLGRGDLITHDYRSGISKLMCDNDFFFQTDGGDYFYTEGSKSTAVNNYLLSFPRDHEIAISEAPFTLRRRNLKTAFSLWKRIKRFPSTLRRRNYKTQQSPVILDFCLRKTLVGESHDYSDVIVFEKLRFPDVFRLHKTKSRRFKIPPAWRAFSKSSVFVTD